MRKEKQTIESILNGIHNYNFATYEAPVYDPDFIQSARRTYCKKYAPTVPLSDLPTLYSGGFYEVKK
jgi:hypothetical protein